MGANVVDDNSLSVPELETMGVLAAQKCFLNLKEPWEPDEEPCRAQVIHNYMLKHFRAATENFG